MISADATRVWVKYAIHDNVEIIHYDFDYILRYETMRHAELIAIKT